jgi:hypothetical protein
MIHLFALLGSGTVGRVTIAISDDLKTNRYWLTCDTLNGARYGRCETLFKPGCGESALGANYQTVIIETERLSAFEQCLKVRPWDF